MRTSIVIPCYNEADGIPQLCLRLLPLVDWLQRRGETEIVFVDDGSTDLTGEVIRREAVALPYRVITHERNEGITAALRTGFQECLGREVVTLDSDCTYEPTIAKDMLEKLLEGFDIVTASPYHPSGEVVGVQGWRLFLSKSLSRIYWLVLPLRLYTYTSCFRAYRKEILRSLDFRSNGFLGVTEILVSAILKGYRIAEIPAVLTKRRFGQSKIRVVRVIISHIRYILYVIYLRVSHQARNVT
jgi:dolichol-phosphate mannosyltransferase